MPFETVATFTALLALAANAATGALIAVRLAARSNARAADLLGTVSHQVLALAGLVAVVSTLGSLYYSEVAHLIPCRMCWFQRILMYPLALILPVAAWAGDRAVRRYVLPLATIGLAFSGYHYLIQHFPSLESSGTCDITAPCSGAYVWKFGFVSIPYMAGSGFLLIATLLTLARRPSSEGHSEDREAPVPGDEARATPRKVEP